MNSDALRPECDAFAETLVDFADGTLDVERAAAVEAHCASCPSCRDGLAALREIPRLLRGADAAAEPVVDWTGQRERILDAIDEIVAAENERRRGFDVRLWLPLAAALVIGLAGLMSLRTDDGAGVGPARVGLAMAISDPESFAEISETLGEPVLLSEALWANQFAAESTHPVGGPPSSDLDSLSDEEIDEVEQLLGV